MCKKDLMAVRITSFEVAKVEGDWIGTTQRWQQLSDQCKGVTNCFWETWLVWHVTRQSRQKLTTWLNKRQQCIKNGTGAKAAGKCPVDPLSKQLGSLIGKTCKEVFPDVHSRVRTLIINTLNRDLRRHKAAKGNLPGHSAILLHQQSIPSSTRPHPIPFDRQNATIIPPEQPDGNFALQLRVGRIDPGNGSRALGIQDTLFLRCQGRRVQSQVAILKRIVSGEFSFRGSKLVYSQKKRKWFAQLAFRRPFVPRPGLDGARVAILLARKDWPWTLVSPAGRKMPGGRGRYVEPVRRSLLLQRWNRKANYRNAGQANKGHGRERAMRDQWRLQQAWKNFTKRAGYGWAKEVIEWCVATGCGQLVYVQPEGDQGRTRFLHNAGKIDGREDSTGWPWFDFGTRLQQKCQENGIECVVVKPLRVRKSAKKSQKDGTGQGVRAGQV